MIQYKFIMLRMLENGIDIVDNADGTCDADRLSIKELKNIFSKSGIKVK